MTRWATNRRGSLFLMTLTTVSALVLLCDMASLRVINEFVIARRVNEQQRALDLAEASLNQFLEEFHQFFKFEVFEKSCASDPICAMAWADRLATSLKSATRPTLENPPFLVTASTERFGVAPWVPRQLDVTAGQTLPTMGNPTQLEFPRTWIVSIAKVQISDPADLNPSDGISLIDDPSPLAARIMTVMAEATIGSITKRIRAEYRIVLQPSSVFKYAYFINNYGWLEHGGGSGTFLWINGEVRSNGDLYTNNVGVVGDLYASVNPLLINPRTGSPSNGLIEGDPWAYGGWYGFWRHRPDWSRPARLLVNPDPIDRGGGTSWLQPRVGGISDRIPLGYGFDTEYDENAAAPGIQLGQRRISEPQSEPMPWLGDQALYKDLAHEWNNGAGSRLSYYGPGPDGKYNTGDDQLKTVSSVYTGSDGVEDPGDKREPLVLVGTPSHPINIDGPVVVPGDVILRGWVTGQGTIYAGRNVHIVDSVQYVDRPSWPALRRNKLTGELGGNTGGGGVAPACDLQAGPYKSYGYVCDDGRYVPAGTSPPLDCISP